jgi:hypothetical protein
MSCFIFHAEAIYKAKVKIIKYSTLKTGPNPPSPNFTLKLFVAE